MIRHFHCIFYLLLLFHYCNYTGKKARAKQNTGRWELIYDAPCSITRSNTSLAADLLVTGTGMSVPVKKKRARAPSFGTKFANAVNTNNSKEDGSNVTASNNDNNVGQLKQHVSPFREQYPVKIAQQNWGFDEQEDIESQPSTDEDEE